MNDKSNDSIDISIRIGNSYDHTKILTGSTYTYKVKRNTFIKELKQMLSDEFNESETKNIINRYNIYNNRIILLNENNVILDAFTESTASDLDLIDNNETLFYALLIWIILSVQVLINIGLYPICIVYVSIITDPINDVVSVDVE